MIYIYMKIFFKINIYSYDFHITKLINLKVIYDVYFQCLIQVLAKRTYFLSTEGTSYFSQYLKLFLSLKNLVSR
jgi:hypothetical protein